VVKKEVGLVFTGKREHDEKGWNQMSMVAAEKVQVRGSCKNKKKIRHFTHTRNGI